MGIVEGLEEPPGFAAAAAAPGQHVDDLRRERLESWAGLTEPGGAVLLSLEQVARGHEVTELLLHESTHDALLQGTPFGMLLAQLAALITPPAVLRIDAARARRLLTLGMRASFVTQEGCATVAAAVGLDAAGRAAYWERLPGAYRLAAEPLRWIEQRGLTTDQQSRLTVAIGHVALSTPVIEDWRARRLADPAAWRAYLREPQVEPDARFTRLCERLSAAPVEALVALIERDDVISAVSESGGVPTYRIPDGTWLAWSTSIAEAVAASLDSQPDAPRDDRTVTSWRARALPEPSGSFGLRVALTHTAWPPGRFAAEPRLDELLRHRLAKLTFNTTGQPVPSFTLADGSSTTLAVDGVSVEGKAPAGNGLACNLPRDL
jgi:hypothetical protein